jgi:cytochrome P450
MSNGDLATSGRSLAAERDAAGRPQAPNAFGAASAYRSARGAQGIKLARRLWELRSDALWPWVEGIKGYGDIVETKIPGARQFTVYRPRHAEHVLVTNQDNYEKGAQHELFATALGRGLVTSNGELWRRQRRLIQPMFAKRHIEVFTDHMTASAERMLDHWDTTVADGGRVDVAEAMMGLTLDVVGRALFGADLTGRSRETIGIVVRDVMTELLAAGYSPLTWAAYALPGMTMARAVKLRPRRQRRFQARIRELDAIVADLIEGHRNGRQPAEADLLTLLLQARDESTDEAMSDRQIRDEVVTFLVAGHETTANALTWMWMLLSRHPEVRARLLDEVDRLLESRLPTFEDADRLPWTRAVIEETLRLYPPVWITARRAIADDVIDDVRVPAGSHVAVLIYLTHRDPDVWPNPEGFDPGRFLDPPARPRGAYIPFTAGRRVCVGNTFALTEATLLTAMIAQRFTLDLDPTVRVEPAPLLTLRVRDGLPMRAYRRPRRVA